MNEADLRSALWAILNTDASDQEILLALRGYLRLTTSQEVENEEDR